MFIQLIFWQNFIERNSYFAEISAKFRWKRNFARNEILTETKLRRKQNFAGKAITNRSTNVDLCS
jgi:hypothetical protein